MFISSWLFTAKLTVPATAPEKKATAVLPSWSHAHAPPFLQVLEHEGTTASAQVGPDHAGGHTQELPAHTPCTHGVLHDETGSATEQF